MKSGIGGCALARLLTLAAIAAAFLLAPAVAAGHGSHGNDVTMPPPPAARGGVRMLADCGSRGPGSTVYGASGFSILTTWNNTCGVAEVRPSAQYTLRLVANGQGDVETMRSSAERAAAQVASATGLQIAVAAGTVPDGATEDRAPLLGEILLSIDDTSPCDATGRPWAGCGGPRHGVGWRNGENEAVYGAGRIWVRSAYRAAALLDRDHLVAHELGHALGLDHFADLHLGEVQVMHGAGDWSAKAFRAGDRNGLAHVTNVPPTAATLAATDVFDVRATLRGTVNPNGYATRYRFEWGTASYSNSIPVPDATAGAGVTSTNVSEVLGGLRPRTTYHYRLVATSAKGTVHGADQTFTTTALDDRAAVVPGFNGTGISTLTTGKDGNIRVSTQLPSGRSAWTAIGADAQSAPAAVRRRDGTVDVFVLWSDGSVRRKQVNPNGVESGWETFGLNGVSAPAASMRRGPNGSVGWIVDVVVRGSGNDLILTSLDTETGRQWGPYSMGGTFRSAPAIVSYFDGGVHVYARGTDDAVHQKFWIPERGDWSDWHWLGGVATSSPAVTSWYDGNIEIGVRGTDGAFYHKGWAPDPQHPNQGEWGDWIRHDAQIDSAPTLSTERPGQLVVTARQGAAIRRRVYDSDAWGSWTSLGDPEAPGEFLSQVAVVEAVDGSGKTSMYVRDGDGVVRTSTTDGLFQTPWRALSGRVNSAPAAVQRADGTTEVFALVNGAVLRKTISPAGAESAWRSIGLNGASAPAASMRRGPNGSVSSIVDVVVRGSGDDLILTSLDTETSRQWGPYSMGGTFRSAPTIMSYFEGGIHVHARGTDDAVHQKFWIPERNDWSPWYWLGGTTGASPTATSWYGGNIEVGILGSDSAFHHKGWNPTAGTDRRGAWGDWIRHDVHLDSPPTLSSGRPAQLRVFGRQGVYVIRRVYDNNAWGSWIWLNNPSLRLINP